MNKLFRLSLISCLLLPLMAIAEGWDETKYKQIEQSIRVPKFAQKDYLITKYGAKPGASAAQNQIAINKAIKACSKKGGRVVVPAGQHFVTGAITLLSHVNLHIEEGATLEFAFQPELYPIVETSWEGLECFNLQPCIYAYKAKDIAVTGKGTIDGGGSNETWWPWCGSGRFGAKEGGIAQNKGARARLLKAGENGIPLYDAKGRRSPERVFGPTDGLRPQLVNFNWCEGILMEDVTLLRSPFWVIHPLHSTDITVRRVKMINDGPNGDGCDPECCDRVLIEDCYFNTGDDCIAIKSGRNRDGRERNMPSKNIIIRRCEMKNGHGGVVVGSEISGGCQNVYAHDCVMDSPELERVLRIKTNSCRGGIIENINMCDIKVGTCKEAVLKINLDYEHNEVCCRGFNPTVRNISLENVTSEKSKFGVMIVALDTICNVYDVSVKNCRFNGVAQGNKITGQTRNINYDNYFVNNSLVLQQMPYKHYSEWMTYSEMKRVPKSYLLDFSTKPKWSYVMGIELEGMLDTYLKYGGEDIRKYCREYTDTMINAQGNIRGYNILDYNLDNIRTGHFVTRMYTKWPEEKNLKAIQTMMRQLKDQPRTVADKVYWHKAIYAYQVWLDGIFMGLPFRCLTASELYKPKEAQKIYDDAVNQLKVTYERTLDPKTGLNRHAYDETRSTFWADKQTGLSQHCWGRAQGWYTMALIEVLDAVPESYPRRGELITLLQKDFDAILKWQDKASGVWYQVMDSPEREGNYLESTCSAMFTYALLKAYRKGYVGAKYRDAGIKAYKGIINRFIRVDADKTISLTNCCSVAGLGPAATPQVEEAMKRVNPKGTVKENKRRDGSYAYYLDEAIRDNDAKGLGPFIWASLEMEMLGYDTANTTAEINRQAVISRNNPIVVQSDPLASLTVGNGHFATTVDVTGLQSYPFEYEAGVPLTAMSDWGWHKFKNTRQLKPEESEGTFQLGHGHDEVYAVEYKVPSNGSKKGVKSRNQLATDFFRANPHRLNLGTIGLELTNRQGQPIPLSQLTGIRQEQLLYDGKIESRFSADGKPVEVTTTCLPDRDALLCQVKTALLRQGQAAVTIRFSYPTGKHTDDGNDWESPDSHESYIVSQDAHSALIEHSIDDTRYYLRLEWDGEAQLKEQAQHVYRLSTKDDVLAFTAEYSQKQEMKPGQGDFSQKLKRVISHWNRWWQEGAIVDFSQCTDPRARELERRVVLSQYLTQVNCANSLPPQETGLTFNSWFGRPHLEMTWWHMVDFALWNRPQVLATVMGWYNSVAYPIARQIAERQGFKGVRWMKMTDPWGGEAPSNTGSFLIWQQPHYIYMAEELYRANPTAETLRKYGELVEATADFMADFVTKTCVKLGQGATFKKVRNQYNLRGATAMQESMSKDFSFNHPFELAYWQYGLHMAQEWRLRQGKERNALWDDIVQHMAPLPEHGGIYTAGLPLMPYEAFVPGSAEAPFDPFKTPEMTGSKRITKADFDEKSRSDHPAVLGACGLLPSHYSGTVRPNTLFQPQTMSKTLDWVIKNWNWDSTWGWDYGMMAMCAARLGQPEQALSALLIDKGKNRYLVSGHNFQTADRLRIYLPGNGALLTAVAMMCAGWDGCDNPYNPGFPQDGKWNVRWEGLQRMQ